MILRERERGDQRHMTKEESLGWLGVPADVVANQAEPCDPGVVLNDASKRGLGVGCHGVGFVQDDEFVGRALPSVVGSCSGGHLLKTVITYQQKYFERTSGRMIWNTDLREGLDFGTDDVDASLVRCVEFHHTRLEQLRPALRGKAQQFSRVPGARELRAEKAARGYP
jgi:hypothetical protein